jgi:phosphopantetheine adenylyltransferase
LDVIAKSAQLFDELIVAIGVHPKKTRRFNKELMQKAIEQVLIRENFPM